MFHISSRSLVCLLFSSSCVLVTIFIFWALSFGNKQHFSLLFYTGFCVLYLFTLIVAIRNVFITRMKQVAQRYTYSHIHFDGTARIKHMYVFFAVRWITVRFSQFHDFCVQSDYYSERSSRFVCVFGAHA